MLSQEKTKIYENKLRGEKQKLLSEIETYSKPEDFGNDVDSLEEEADESQAFGDRLAVAQTLKERVNEIDSALNKIQLGTYGVCENCGGEIPEKILKIAPESVLCEKCKKKKE